MSQSAAETLSVLPATGWVKGIEARRNFKKRKVGVRLSVVATGASGLFSLGEGIGGGLICRFFWGWWFCWMNLSYVSEMIS